MTIAYSCAISHAPGIVAWVDAAPKEQKDALYAGFARLRAELVQAKVEEIILFTSEHWANFFLDHISAFCIGRGASFEGPLEPWLKIEKTRVTGDPELATEVIERCYESSFEPGFTFELAFDHGTMIPLHFLMPDMELPVVPIVFNTLASPQPSARRSMELGRIIGEVARRSSKRIALVATGGMSHDPGEINHGFIDEDFDRRFLKDMVGADLAALSNYSTADLLGAGAGAVELLSWIALAGALGDFSGEIIAYEPVKAWATGIGLMTFAQKAA